MRGETTCPTCGSLVESKVVYDSFLPDGIINSGHRARVAYRTTADPARLARLESLLREIGAFFKNSGGWAEVHSHIYESWQDRIAALVGGTDGTE